MLSLICETHETSWQTDSHRMKERRVGTPFVGSVKLFLEVFFFFKKSNLHEKQKSSSSIWNTDPSRNIRIRSILEEVGPQTWSSRFGWTLRTTSR